MLTEIHDTDFSVVHYRDEIYPLQNLLSRTQAGPGRTVKKEQEEILPNHVQRINLISVLGQSVRPRVYRVRNATQHALRGPPLAFPKSRER